MTPERWQAIKELLGTALEMPSAERPAYLDRICGGDVDLRREVERLLSAEQQLSPEFLNRTDFELAATSVLQETANPRIGRRVGPYQIVEQIGAGGMGEVYRAFRADDHYRKEVALKLVRAGQDSGYVISRFRNERQILASLDHPNIARLLDGGTTEDGLPYFVMELIEGMPITEYCDQHKISITGRLQLFSRVCAAVQYAHQRLIIHRDIKPGNILVTTDGTPKLLDFGIAKILDFDSASGSPDATLTAFRVLTPRYASPEQIRGETMTTASDVYSLGMVLYELLTGLGPYKLDSATPQEIAQAACSVEPRRPSTAVSDRKAASNPASQDLETVGQARSASTEKLRKRLSGDLDTIVLMALRKEPSRRYSSVGHLMEDVRRHLENIPVIARKDTARYRAAKFVARHKAGVLASAAVVLALLVGFAMTLHEARVARQQAELASRQRARAERRFNDVRKLANSLMFEVHDSIQDLPGATAARKLLASRALEYLDSLSQESAGELALQRELAGAYERVGDVMGYDGGANLGDFSGALQSYKKALAIRESAAASNPDNVQVQSELLNEYFRVSFALNSAGDDQAALICLDKGVQLAKQFVRHDAKYQDWLAGFYWQRGYVLAEAGEYDRALESYRQSTALHEAIARDPNPNPMVRTHLAGDYIGLGKMLWRTGDPKQGEETVTKGVQILRQLERSNPGSATLREYLGEGYYTLATVAEDQHEFDQALESNRKARQIFADLLASDPKNSLAKDNYGLSDLGIGQVLVRRGQISEGVPHIRNAATLFEAIPDKNRYAILGQARSYSALAMAEVRMSENTTAPSGKIEHLRAASAWYRKSLGIWQTDPHHGSPDASGDFQSEQVTREAAKCEAELARLSVTAGHATGPPVLSQR